MEEIWKDIEGYKGLYQVSNLGRVKSLNYRRTGKEGIMKGVDDGCGYLQVALSKDGKDKKCRLNRLVAQAFLENPNSLPEVNHKNEDKTDNCVENLEWCDRAYNVNYGTGNKNRAEKRSKPLYSINKESGLVTYWESAKVASRQTGIAKQNICACLKGNRKSAGGHIWLYADED